MNRLIELKTQPSPFRLVLCVACFGLVPLAEAVFPPPDGGYPGFNTAEGQNALLSLTTGQGNTAVGWRSLFSNAAGSFNTATGAGALLLNTGDQNTATGAGALLSNTAGEANTANGASALLSNTTGSSNTAIGLNALFNNTTGFTNTATGINALLNNINGIENAANGSSALLSNSSGSANTANGRSALFNNTTGDFNTALGYRAGFDVTTANNVIAIGTPGQNVDNSCYIGNIFEQVVGFGAQVFVNSAHKLGTVASSKRFKEEIRPTEQASEALFALKPVTFRYKKEIDPAGTSQFGLVAEEVEKVNPDLVVRDKEGKPYSVRYDQVNAMLLNEFLKEHRTVQEQKATIAELKSTVEKQEATNALQQKEIEALTAGLQKVSAQMELNKFATRRIRSGGPALQMATNNH